MEAEPGSHATSVAGSRWAARARSGTVATHGRGSPCSAPDLIGRLIGAGPATGTIELRRPDGTATRVQYRSAPNVPGIGLHAAILSSPDEPLDRRPVAAIVTEALGLGSLAALESGGSSLETVETV